MKRETNFFKNLHKDLLSEKLSTSESQTQKILKTVINNLSEEVSNGQTVILKNFGVFSTSFRTFTGFGSGKIRKPSAKFKFSIQFKKKMDDKLKEI